MDEVAVYVPVACAVKKTAVYLGGMILSQNIYPIPFMVLAMLGGTAVVILVVGIATSWPPTSLSSEKLYLMAKIALFAVVFILLALRPRVVAFNDSTNDVTVSWGKNIPLTYKTYHADGWTSFTIEKYTPIGIMPVGGVMKAYHLEPRFRLDGVTTAGKTVTLGTFATESEANDWKAKLTSVAK